jgi:hypothetical protein
MRQTPTGRAVQPAGGASAPPDDSPDEGTRDNASRSRLRTNGSAMAWPMPIPATSPPMIRRTDEEGPEPERHHDRQHPGAAGVPRDRVDLRCDQTNSQAGQWPAHEQDRQPPTQNRHDIAGSCHQSANAHGVDPAKAGNRPVAQEPDQNHEQADSDQPQRPGGRGDTGHVADVNR